MSISYENLLSKVWPNGCVGTCHAGDVSSKPVVHVGKAKFRISDDVNVFFVSEDDEEAEIESEILEKVHGNKSLLIMKCDRSEQSHWRESQGDKTVYGAGCKDRYQGKEESSSEEDQHMSAPKTRNITEHETKKWREVEEGAAIKAHVAKFGLKGIGNVLKKNLEKWKETPLHIAVTGASGKGKSSFINALRRVSARDPRAAQVGVKECTTKPTPYSHPYIDNFVLWDVPGVGTLNFPEESYLKKINVDTYDFFIVVFSERFTKTDYWLMNEISKRNKRCYMVRTKIDVDIANLEHSSMPIAGGKNPFVELKKELREEMVKSFKGCSSFPFFMISNHHTLKYDFQQLEFQLLKDVPFEKKTAMVLGVAGISKEAVQEKVKVLESRLWQIALMSGACAAIPIPFVSSGIDASIILKEVLFYRSQFALDDTSLSKLAEIANITLDKLKSTLDLQTPEALFTSSGIKQFLGTYAAAGAAEKLVQYTLPVVGTVICCGASFGATYYVLGNILNDMKKDALKVLQFIARKLNNEAD